jgi:hypothetical protein
VHLAIAAEKVDLLIGQAGIGSIDIGCFRDVLFEVHCLILTKRSSY